MELLNEEYLAHHGILGMKWGVRRYQNEDGTYTSLGKKREREEYDGSNSGNGNTSGNNNGNGNSSGKNGNNNGNNNGNGGESPGKRAWNDISNAFKTAAGIPGKAHAANKAGRMGKVDLSKMSDEELFARTNRLNLERNYMSALNQSDVSYGAQRAQQILEIVGSVASIAAAASNAQFNFAQAKQMNAAAKAMNVSTKAANQALKGKP